MSAEGTRKTIMEAAYAQFRRKGYYRVSVDEIAAAAKVTKRTLYYHFESKDALLEAVLRSQHETVFRQFQDFGLRPGAEPAQIVATIFSELAAWSAKPGWAGSGFTRLAMELADLPGHPARKVARHHKTVLEWHLAQTLADGGAAAPRDLARNIWLLLEGAMVLTLIHGDRSYLDAAARAARTLVGEGQRPVKPRAKGRPGRRT